MKITLQNLAWKQRDSYKQIRMFSVTLDDFRNLRNYEMAGSFWCPSIALKGRNTTTTMGTAEAKETQRCASKTNEA